MEDLQEQLDLFLQTEGKKYLSGCKGNSEIVHCPDGFLELPIDFWRCKINKELCPIQSLVYIDNKENVWAGCHTSKEKQDQIFNTIKARKYDGFHHILGRRLCPLCPPEEVIIPIECHAWTVKRSKQKKRRKCRKGEGHNYTTITILGS
jgi:hypothetical protein